MEVRMLVQKPAYSVVAQPDVEPRFKIIGSSGHENKDVRSFFLDLLASDRSPETIKAYAFGLCKWFNFLYARAKFWKSAGLQDLRDYVLHLRSAENPYRIRRQPGSAEAGSANPRTGKPSLGTGYKPSTINHRLSVIQSFYDFQRHAGTVSTEIVGQNRSRLAHHNPLEPWLLRGRARYRQGQPKRIPRGISDGLWNEIFDSLKHDRARAILCLLTSSGSRAQELLNMKGSDVGVVSAFD